MLHEDLLNASHHSSVWLIGECDDNQQASSANYRCNLSQPTCQLSLFYHILLYSLFLLSPNIIHGEQMWFWRTLPNLYCPYVTEIIFSCDGDSPSFSLEIIILLTLGISGPHPTLLSMYSIGGSGEDPCIFFFIWKLLFH